MVEPWRRVRWCERSEKVVKEPFMVGEAVCGVEGGTVSPSSGTASTSSAFGSTRPLLGVRLVMAQTVRHWPGEVNADLVRLREHGAVGARSR